MTQDISSLDDILNGSKAEATPEPQQVETPAAPPEAKAETGDKGQSAAPPADAKPQDAAQADNAPLVPRKALEDERRKRKEYEQRLSDLERQLKAGQAQRQQLPPQQEFTPPDPWTDPEGAMRYQAEVLTRKMDEQIFMTRLTISEELMRAKPDFEETVSLFGQAVQQDPSLEAKFYRHPQPAKFAYEIGKRFKLLSEIGNDPEAYRQKLESELMAKLQAQAPAQADVQTPPPKAPKSLASTPGAPLRDKNGQFTSGTRSLDDILGG